MTRFQQLVSSAKFPIDVLQHALRPWSTIFWHVDRHYWTHHQHPRYLAPSKAKIAIRPLVDRTIKHPRNEPNMTNRDSSKQKQRGAPFGSTKPRHRRHVPDNSASTQLMDGTVYLTRTGTNKLRDRELWQ
jgi:hypothetical protein